MTKQDDQAAAMPSATVAELVSTDAQRAPESREDHHRAANVATAAAAPARQESGNFHPVDGGRAIEVEDLNSANDGGAA